jgi:uncharacterized hydrophobic protein (TIGR00271 family)
MLHLAVVTPAASADEVLRVLNDERGVANIARFPGAVLVPEGDRIEADVVREAADDLVERLRPVVTGVGGSVALHELSTAIGHPIERASREAPGLAVDAVVWEEVTARTNEDATLSLTFLVFLVVGTLICGVGILTDSEVLIVGGMVLGPEFGPLAAVAVALVQRRPRRIGHSLRPLLLGFPLAIATTAAGVALLRVAGAVPQGYLDGHRPLTSFVSSPDVFSVVVALLAGVAGIVSLTASKSTALVGVFISVTTLPAAADIGASLVTGRFGETVGAVAQLLLNLTCILAAATATLLVQRRLLRGKRMRRSLERARAQRPVR